MSSRYEEYVRLRKEGNTPHSLASVLEVSSPAVYKYEARFKASLPEGEDLPPTTRKVRRPVGSVSKTDLQLEVSRLRKELSEIQQGAPIPLGELNTYEYGYLAESFAQYRLERQGFKVFRPTTPTSGTDLLVIYDGRAIRCEVKSTRCQNVGLVHTVLDKATGKGERRHYTAEQVDFFLVVDLVYEHFFVLPLLEARGRMLRVTPDNYIWQFKDRYDLLRGVA